MKILCLLLTFVTISFRSVSQDFGVTETLASQLQKIVLSDSISFERVIAEALSDLSDSRSKAELLLETGTFLVSNYEYEKADLVLKQCMDYATDEAVLAEANFQAGLSLMYRDIRIRSLKNFETAFDIFLTIGDSLGMGKSLDKIADNNNYIGEHRKARPYYDRCIKIFTAIRDTARLTNVLGNIGGMFSEEANNDSAIVYYNEAIRLNEMAGNLSNLSSDLAGLGIALEGLGRLDESLIHYHRALNVARAVEDEEMVAFAYQHLGYHHFNRGNVDSAGYYMNLSNEYARKMNYAQLLINTFDVLHQVYYEQADYKKGYEILNEYKQLQDSLLILENVGSINSLRAEYENRVLQQKADLREEVIEKQSRLTTTLIVSSILSGLGLIALIWLNQKRRNKNLIIQRDKDLINAQAEQLKELDHLKSIFFANVSHDLRAPVGLIKGFVQLLKQNEENLKGDSLEFIDHIETTLERLSKMADEINQLVQLEENRFELDYSEINVNDFFGTLGKLFESGIQFDVDQQFQFECNVDEGISIQADKSALEKIVFNVVGNAFKYNTTGTKVGLYVDEVDSNLVIKVVDDGPGIIEDKIDKIFDRYYRTETGSKVAIGQGIGLSLVKDLVDLQGGDISVNSIPDEETCFTIKMPLNPRKT